MSILIRIGKTMMKFFVRWSRGRSRLPPQTDALRRDMGLTERPEPSRQWWQM